MWGSAPSAPSSSTSSPLGTSRPAGSSSRRRAARSPPDAANRCPSPEQVLSPATDSCTGPCWRSLPAIIRQPLSENVRFYPHSSAVAFRLISPGSESGVVDVQFWIALLAASARIFRAAFQSAFAENPQCLHENSAWFFRLPRSQCPQRLHVLLVLRGSTSVHPSHDQWLRRVANGRHTRWIDIEAAACNATVVRDDGHLQQTQVRRSVARTVAVVHHDVLERPIDVRIPERVVAHNDLDRCKIIAPIDRRRRWHLDVDDVGEIAVLDREESRRGSRCSLGIAVHGRENACTQVLQVGVLNDVPTCHVIGEPQPPIIVVWVGQDVRISTSDHVIDHQVVGLITEVAPLVKIPELEILDRSSITQGSFKGSPDPP